VAAGDRRQQPGVDVPAAEHDAGRPLLRRGSLAAEQRRHESEAGRRLVLLTRVPDRPGSLARLLSLVGEAGANLVDVEHLREGLDLHVRETGVQMVLETRGADHAREVMRAVREAGYEARLVH
jgi:threonine dehydratase